MYLSGGNVKQENSGIDSGLSIKVMKDFSLPSIKEDSISEAWEGESVVNEFDET